MTKCCNKDPIWVENVRDKGYYFCKKCRKEVVEANDSHKQLTQAEIDKMFDEWKSMSHMAMQVSYFPQDQVDLAVKDLMLTCSFLKYYDAYDAYCLNTELAQGLAYGISFWSDEYV